MTRIELHVEGPGSRRPATTAGSSGEPTIVQRAAKPAPRSRCRTNSRRGFTNPEHRSYPPVGALCRGLEVLRAVNKFSIASIAEIHRETSFPKPTIVRMLETLMAEGYVARDNMCGGYRVTHRVHELYAGYEGISQVIEISTPMATDLTRRIKWPIGIGVVDGHKIAIKFWTGAISPWAHRNTVLGLRPSLLTSAMGRAYLGFCSDEKREQHLRWLRADPESDFGDAEERRFRLLLERVRVDGYAIRDPRNKPTGTTTLAMPIIEGDAVQAVISVSFFTTALTNSEIAEQIVAPLRATTTKIEDALAFVNSGGLTPEKTTAKIEPDF